MVQDKAIDAEDAFHKAELQLKKTKQDLAIVKAKKDKDELDDYKYMLHKIEKVTGNRKTAEDVLKEVII